MLARIDDPRLSVHVVWVPRNGARQRHVDRVLDLVTDERARQYWDGQASVIDQYDDMLVLTGPCAGVFLIYPARARWDDATPPRPAYVMDAHAREYDRPHPQWDADEFADLVRAYLGQAPAR